MYVCNAMTQPGETDGFGVRTYKTFMEEYGEFLKYVRNLLNNSSDNPLRTALAISI